MRFDFDAFAGALVTLSEALDTASTGIGIPREALMLAISRHAAIRRNKRDAEFWKNAVSQKKLGDWIYRDTGRSFTATDEREILEVAREIPARIRRNLIEIAKSLSVPQGGKRRKLDVLGGFEARRLVRTYQGKGLSKEEAYKKAAKKMKASPHTIRRECEPKERERTRKPKENAMNSDNEFDSDTF